MTLSIVATKLNIPQQPKLLIPRTRLTAMLTAGIQGKLILISAPAGFGKTTLIAEWARQSREERILSWVHLEGSDNQPVRFLSYLIASLQAHHENLGEVALAGLQSIPPPPIEATLTSLVNEIGSLNRDLILILDDYHLIDNSSIHRAIEFLLDHMPSRMCLVIATRVDPPLPLHRLRARGQMTEVRARDLRFSSRETQEYLSGILNFSLSGSDVAALDRRIEGWIAGLQMLALSIRGKEGVHGFIESFSGSHRFIMDFLTEEILFQQPEHLQSFLLRTSILDRLSGPLCDAVLSTETPGQDEKENPPPSQHILEHLEHANLFLLPLDDERRWYRYHHLFANVLRQHMRRNHPEEISGLYQRASAWYRAHGHIEEAFGYALAADDVLSAAQLVESHALEYLKQGSLPTLLAWLNRLPEEIVMGRPWLSVFCSWALLLTGNLKNIDRYLAAAEASRIPPEDTGDMRGHIVAIHAYASAMQGDVEQGLALAHEALDLLSMDNLAVRSVVTFVLGGVNILRRDIPAAIAAMKEAAETGERAGNIHLAVSALSSAGDLMLHEGKLTEAERIYGQALKLGTGRSGKPLPIAASVYSGLAEIQLARRDLKNARHFAEAGVELAGHWGNVDSLASSYLALAHVSRLEGDPSAAELALGNAKRLAASHSLTPGTEERIAALEAMIQAGAADPTFHGLLVDPLTERELEVLRLMAIGRSNPEIASELVIALGTVKAHTSSIYRKLDTRSRIQAVVRARELGLLK